MSGGLVKELMLDYAMNRLSVDLRSDLTVALQEMARSSVFSSIDFQYLCLYLAGYTAEEIAARYITTTDKIEPVLERIFTAIEEYSGYTDNNFIHKIETSKQYRKIRVLDLRSFLEQHSKRYTAHEIHDIESG